MDRHTLIIGASLLALPTAWLFGWSAWGLISASALYFVIIWTWLCGQRSGRRAELLPENGCEIEFASPEQADNYISKGRTIWKGERRVHFLYGDFEQGYTELDFTVHTVITLGRYNRQLYFRGHCHVLGYPRTFRVDRIKGRKVKDVATGKLTTFRQLFKT